jgi:polyisoprenoid-binding protein YceI
LLNTNLMWCSTNSCKALMLFSTMGIFLILASCSTPESAVTPDTIALAEFPFETYQQAAETRVYKIDGQSSSADIIVKRGGSLARFGHDHIISVTDVFGFILVNEEEIIESKADLIFDLSKLVVDETASRNRYQLDTSPSKKDIENTQHNMHNKVLETMQHPEAYLSISVTGVSQDVLHVDADIFLHGLKNHVPVDVKTTGLGTERLSLSGQFSLLQSDFGIRPLSILGGGLKVMDNLEIHFNLQANKHIGPIGD